MGNTPLLVGDKPTRGACGTTGSLCWDHLDPSGKLRTIRAFCVARIWTILWGAHEVTIGSTTNPTLTVARQTDDTRCFALPHWTISDCYHPRHDTVQTE